MTRLNQTLSFLFTIFLVMLFASTLAQNPADQIYKIDGTIVSAKVLEITNSEIKYKKASNTDGPTYTILRSDVLKIMYLNGEEESYGNKSPQAKSAVGTNEVPFDGDNFLTFSNDGQLIVTDLTLADKKTYLCFWGFDLTLRKKLIFDNRCEWQGIYNWQIIDNNGFYLDNARLYDGKNKLLTTFINPKTNNPFGADAQGNIISPNGRRVLIKTTENAGKGPMYLFDNNGVLLKTIKIGVTGVGAWKFSHSGSYFLMLRGNSLSKKGTIYVYDSDGNDVCQINLEDAWDDYKYYPYNKYGYFGYKEFMDFSFDDKLIISPRDMETVAIWDTKGNLLKTFPHFHPKVAAISRDGNRVVTVGGLPFGKEEKVNEKLFSAGQIKVWSIDGALLKEISFPANPSSVEFLPDNSGFVVTVDGLPIWFWQADDYKLPEGYDQILPLVAKGQDEVRTAQRANEKRERQKNLWGGLATGFIKGMANYDKEMGKSNLQKAAAEKFISETVNKALTDCHYVVFTRITKDDDLAVSDIIKITRGCELNVTGANIKFADTYEELDKWIKATVAKEDKDHDRDDVPFDEMNNHFKNEAFAGQGGCLCKK